MRNPSIKATVEALLIKHPTTAYTMGEIIAMAGIDKRMASDVSSALHKLQGKAKVRTVRGPSKSAKGPRFVRLYQWRKQAETRAAALVTGAEA